MNLIYPNLKSVSIFLKFGISWHYTKFSTKSESGTGLGLFISKSIEAHDGRICAENNSDGNGATISFGLSVMKK